MKIMWIWMKLRFKIQIQIFGFMFCEEKLLIEIMK